MTDELYPSDGVLNALAGADDAEQEIYYPDYTADEPHYTEMYKLIQRLLKVARRAGDLRVFKDAALTFGVRAGRYFNGDTAVNYSQVLAQALTNNATNRIYLTAAGVLTVNTTGFPVPSVTPHIPLAEIVTSAGAYDGRDASEGGDITDYRGRGFLTVCGAAGGSLNALDWQESVLDELDFTAAEPAAPTLGDRYLNTGTGASSVTGQTVAANDIEEWNGTSWTEITPTEGACCLVEDRDMLIGYNGSVWIDLGTFANIKDLTDGGNADSLHVHDTAGLEDGAVNNAKIAADAAIARSKLAEESLVRYRIPLTLCRNADGSVMDTAGGVGKFRIIAGGWGSGDLIVRQQDSSDTPARLSFEFPIPPEFIAAGSIQVVVRAKEPGFMSSFENVDVEAYELSTDGVAGADLNGTAAQTLAATFDDYTFVIDGSGLAVGDKILVLVEANSHAATIGATIGSIEIQQDIKG